MQVWAKGPEDGKVVVLMHGRTWSARPVWDLQVAHPIQQIYLIRPSFPLGSRKITLPPICPPHPHH